MDNTQKSLQQNSWWSAATRTSSFAWTGWIFGLIGVMWSFYTYQVSKIEPDLSYYVRPIRTVIVKAGDISKLSVNWEGKVLTSDVTISQIAIWNAGKKPIVGSTDVLKTLKILTENHVQILDATIQKTSRPIADLKIDNTEFANGAVGLTWRVLEQNDGCVLQIIYAGNENVSISAEGAFLGQFEPRRVRYNSSIRTPEEQYRPKHQTIQAVIEGLILFAWALTLFLGLINTVKLYESLKRSDKISRIFTICLGLLGIGLLWWMSFGSRPDVPFNL